MASVKQFQVTFDCAEPERVARFWCEVLGYVVPPPPDGFATWDHYQQAMLDGSLYFATFTAIISACLVGLPALVVQLNRRRDTPDDVAAESPVFQLSGAIESVTFEIFNERSMQSDNGNATPR